ncbi:apolipoprotein N-acyltransferase [Nocardioides iriomotensis]|uniref:Apolipoprotein N-acyltransferase n=1 Tax=Nocardioides iriomotensis TaxID=715784 RepID=A0A4Q5J1S1_9ACTN|nr:apolipoprotein N-acyltransferase [Nocardioides iriomotensis]RYU11578.1 apolipoprotein N-acyltransferase [Nocardioides iriomotensis]
MTSLPARLLLAVAAGLVTALAFEPFAIAWLAPLGVAGVTLAAVGTRPSRGFLVGLVFGLAFMGLLLPWLQMIHPAAWPALAALEALFYGLGGLATTVVARLPRWPLWVAAVWVLVELLRSSVPFGGFPWGRLGFAVVDTPALPTTAYVGVPGTTFLVALVGATLAWLVLRGRTHLLRGVGVLAATVVLLCAGSAASLPGAPGPTEDPAIVTIASVQGDVPGVGLDAFSERRVVLDNHVQATHDLADRVDAGEAPQPDLVVWPENSSDIDPFADPTVEQDVADAARAVGAPLLMGAAVGDRADDGWFNRAIVWSPDGRPEASYDKQRPVPFGEYVPLRPLLAPYISALDQIPTDMVRGTEPGVLDVGFQAGVAMCFEVAYDDLMHALVDDGASVILVPTNNATYTGTGQIEQQFAMSRVRAVETGRYVVVASTNGISGIIAPDGSVVRRAPEQETVVLEEGVQLRSVVLPAVRFGRGIELGLAGLAVLATLAGLVGYRRRSPVAQPEKVHEHS